MDELPYEGDGASVGCLGTVVGVLVVCVGLIIVGYRAYELASMNHTTGIAVKYERGMKGGGPHVRYEVDGESYVAGAYAYRDSDIRSGVATGDRVGVYYWPDEPSNSKVDLFMELWSAALMTLVVGSGFVLLGQILYRTSRSRSPID